ncbi:MAG TPA: C4-type zinc ribbon domain-containing protein [Terriglobia bacterium]|nr:C4-type zinc ribbon domain-containing protein [Terriglobia bacterium]
MKRLIRLQTIDLDIQQLKIKIDLFPAISKALDDKLRDANGLVTSAQEKSKNNQATRKKLEGEVSGLETKISKYREQMLSVKTNEEYKALQKEIEHTQDSIRKVEDSILALMLEAESSQHEIRSAEGRLKEDQQLVNQERRELEGEHQKDVSAMESCVAERKELEAQISADLLPRYERVRKFRGGIGISAARDYICEVCKVRIRPQVFQEIRKNDQIIACDACQRILYNPENLDHPFETV